MAASTSRGGTLRKDSIRPAKECETESSPTTEERTESVPPCARRSAAAARSAASVGGRGQASSHCATRAAAASSASRLAGTGPASNASISARCGSRPQSKTRLESTYQSGTGKSNAGSGGVTLETVPDSERDRPALTNRQI